MNMNKQPGISFDNVILKEVVFSRKQGYSERPELIIALDSVASFSENNENLAYELTCKITDQNESFSVKCSMVGHFSVIKGQENMTLREYSDVNAPAAIFPYIRETIASLSVKAGIPPVIIPPINISAIKDKSAVTTN